MKLLAIGQNAQLTIIFKQKNVNIVTVYVYLLSVYNTHPAAAAVVAFAAAAVGAVAVAVAVPVAAAAAAPVATAAVMTTPAIATPVTAAMATIVPGVSLVSPVALWSLAERVVLMTATGALEAMP